MSSMENKIGDLIPNSSNNLPTDYVEVKVVQNSAVLGKNAVGALKCFQSSPSEPCIFLESNAYFSLKFVDTRN